MNITQISFFLHSYSPRNARSIHTLISLHNNRNIAFKTSIISFGLQHFNHHVPKALFPVMFRFLSYQNSIFHLQQRELIMFIHGRAVHHCHSYFSKIETSSTALNREIILACKIITDIFILGQIIFGINLMYQFILHCLFRTISWKIKVGAADQ